jgi:hypothetical protein
MLWFFKYFNIIMSDAKDVHRFFIRKILLKRPKVTLSLFFMIMGFGGLTLWHAHDMGAVQERKTRLTVQRVQALLQEIHQEIHFIRKYHVASDDTPRSVPSSLPASLIYELKDVLPGESPPSSHLIVFSVKGADNSVKALRFDRARVTSFLGVKEFKVVPRSAPPVTEKGIFTFAFSDTHKVIVKVEAFSFLSALFREKAWQFYLLLGVYTSVLLAFQVGTFRGRQIAQKKLKHVQRNQTAKIEVLIQERDTLYVQCHRDKENREHLALKIKKEKELQQEMRRRTTRALEKIGVLSSVVQSSLLNPELYEEKECLSLLSDISSSATALKDGLPRQTLCETTPLESLVEDVLMLLRHDAGKAGISLQSMPLSPGIEARTDPLLLKLVLSYIVKKSLSLLYEGRVIVSLSVVGEMPLIRILQEGESVHEDKLFTNDKRVIAGFSLDQRLMESLCQRLNLRVLKISSHETHLFVGESDARPEKIPSYISESSPNVIPLFS